MKIIYWVIFPQGIKKSTMNGELVITSYSNYMEAKNRKTAILLLEKYDGAYFEEIKITKKGRFQISWSTLPEFDNKNITKDELWDRWENKPRIELEK